MKRNTILLIAAFILLSGALSAGDWSYYRRDGSRRTLTPCESLVTVKFAAETPPLQPSELANSGLLSQDHEVSEIGMGFWLYRLAEGIELDSAIGGLLDYPEIAFVNPVLVADYSRLMFAGDQIILRTQDVVLAAGIHEAFGRLGLQVLVEPDSVTPFYLVALSESSPGTVFDIADSLFETGFCRYSNPNFFGDLAIMHWAPNDTFYPQQWHLNHPADLPGKPGADIAMELAWENRCGRQHHCRRNTGFGV